ncbi:MAG: mannose-6-phosphate isomerase [Actinobacteria bacterium]|nr:mannose-6-phosphate isomerase [Actinomycetota bacterium]
MGPIYFGEIFKEKVWGGQNLARLLGKELPSGQNIGESWELSDFGEDCSVVAEGELAGQSLRTLLAEHSREITGQDGVTEFGLLFKYLDAVGTLSVQVHPSKHEAWYILEARPGAKLYLGIKQGVGRKEFEAAVAEGTVEQCLASIEPQTGELYYIPAGLTHALGAGIVVAEIQTSEQITYRVYDWGRDRPIQVQLSLGTINFQAQPKCITPLPEVPGETRTLLDGDYFSVDRGIRAAGQSIYVEPGQAQVWMILSGAGHYQYEGETMRVQRGQTILLPACWGGKIEIDEQMCVLTTHHKGHEETQDKS